MTRETKVGLLVGMAIILLIGIIVSDLLVEPAATAPPALQRLAGGLERELATADPASAAAQSASSRWAHPAPPAAERYRPVPTPAELQQNTPPPGFENGNRAAAPIAAGRIASTQHQVVTFDRPAAGADASAAALMQPSSSAPAEGAATSLPALPAVTAVLPREVTTAVLVDATRPGAAPAPAAVNTITVGGGDTLYRIAERTLGDGNRWRELYDANRDTLKSPEQLRPGMTLRIPGRSAPATASAAASARPENGRAAVYTVQSGDTLYAIAQRRLGNGNRWRELYEANRGVIGSDPQRLEAGMKLALPR